MDADRLPMSAVRRTTVLGFLIGGVLRALRWSKEYLQEQVQTRALGSQAASDKGRDEVVDIGGDVDGATKRTAA